MRRPPYPACCDHCVRGKSGVDARRSEGAQVSEVPTVSLHYFFVGKRREDQLKALAVRGGESEAASAQSRRTSTCWTTGASC